MLKIVRLCGLVAFLSLGVAAVGCGKKDDAAPAKKDDKKKDEAKKEEPKAEEPKKEEPKAEAAKPSKEDCEKLAQHQVDIETDESMKNAMKASIPGLIDSCMTATKAQVDCMMVAKDGPGFADCLMQK
jgi:hypothetical protein